MGYVGGFETAESQTDTSQTAECCTVLSDVDTGHAPQKPNASKKPKAPKKPKTSAKSKVPRKLRVPKKPKARTRAYPHRGWNPPPKKPKFSKWRKPRTKLKAYSKLKGSRKLKSKALVTRTKTRLNRKRRCAKAKAPDTVTQFINRCARASLIRAPGVSVRSPKQTKPNVSALAEHPTAWDNSKTVHWNLANLRAHPGIATGARCPTELIFP